MLCIIIIIWNYISKWFG